MVKRLAPVVLFLAIGAFLGGIVGMIFVGDPTYMAAIVGGFLLFLLTGVIAGNTITASMAGHAIARVDSVQRMGTSSGDLQLCTLRLRVKPDRAPAFEATTEYYMSPEQLRTIGPGAVLVVMRHPDKTVSVVSVPSAEWLAKAESARRDPSFFGGPVLQDPNPASPPRRTPLVVRLALVLLGAGLVLIPAYGSIARAAESIAAGDWDGTSMVTGNYQQLAVDAIAEVAGGYEFTSIGFFDTYVIAVAPTYPGADTTDEYMWRYGHAYREGPDLIQEEDLQSVLFDASELDFSVVGRVTREALANTPVEGVDTVYPRVDGSIPKISVYIDGTYKSESLTYDFDGTLVEKR